MADSFTSTLKEFEKIVQQIADAKEQLGFLEFERDRLRKRLRALANGTIEPGSTEPGERPRLGLRAKRPTEAILAIVDAIVKLGGQGTVAKIAAAANLEPKVAATRLQRATGIGAVERLGHGIYKLPESAEDVVVEEVSGSSENLPDQDSQPNNAE